MRGPLATDPIAVVDSEYRGAKTAGICRTTSSERESALQ